MKKSVILTMIAFPLFLMSCGNDAEHKVDMEKQRNDSIKRADSGPLTPQKRSADSLLLISLQKQLDVRKADLDFANGQLDNIKDFHPDRTPAELNGQVEQKTGEIRIIQNDVNNLQAKIDAIKNRMGIPVNVQADQEKKDEKKAEN